jgi:ech hydrogenase subunit D
MNLLVEDIRKDELIERIQFLKDQGYRFVTATAHKEGDHYEITYHFDLDYRLLNIRINAIQQEKLPSISNIYSGAFLIENEYQDLYGLTFENLTIDYHGRLYLTPDSPKQPLVEKSAAVKGA